MTLYKKCFDIIQSSNILNKFLMFKIKVYTKVTWIWIFSFSFLLELGIWKWVCLFFL